MKLAFEDRDCETLGVEKAVRAGDRWEITRDDGWSFGGIKTKDAEAAGVPEIVPGDRITFWPASVGQTVRGVAINGRVIYYRTTWEEDSRAKAELAKEREKRDAELSASITDRNRRWDALPDALKQRAIRFGRTNEHWRRDYETYELSVCEDAARIADALKTEKAIEAFRELPWKEQLEKVPGLFDGYSGNSFGMAVRLAHWLVTDPARATLEHGSLCMLVGCKDYGDERPS